MEATPRAPKVEQNPGLNKVDKSPGRLEALSQPQASTERADDSRAKERDLSVVRTRIRPHIINDRDDCLNVIGWTTKSIVIQGIDWAAWPTEVEKRCPEWREAFKGSPLSGTVGQPSRLVNVQSGKVESPKEPVQYAAVSYAWSQWKDIETMLCRLKSLMGPTKVVYAWIDQLCIIQDSEADKRAEIRRMRDYYAQAAITYVMVPEWSTTFTWELSGFGMSKEQAGRAAAEVRALENTEWASRVWTFQEALLSSRTVFVGRCEVKSATELAVASALDWMEGDSNGYVHAQWRRSAKDGTSVNAGPATWGFSVKPTHILRDSVILTATERSKTKYDYLDDLWKISGERQCKLEEDRVYGMLGLLRGGDAMDLEYGIGFEEAVNRAAKLGLVSSGILLAETNSQQTGRCWCPSPGTESRYMPTERTNLKPDEPSKFQPIRLTPEGLCKVQAARFQMPRRPERLNDYDPKFFHINGEDGRDFDLMFDSGVPKDEEWRGDWLAVVELGNQYYRKRATLVKYETQSDGRLHKLLALEAHISSLEDDYLREFLLG